jgi:hypothetical protein
MLSFLFAQEIACCLTVNFKLHYLELELELVLVLARLTK